MDWLITNTCKIFLGGNLLDLGKEYICLDVESFRGCLFIANGVYFDLK